MSGKIGGPGPHPQLGRALRTGFAIDPVHHGVMPPIYPSTNFLFESVGEAYEHQYGRTTNPTRDLLGEAIATLEGGAGATIAASGLGAFTVACHALVPAGGRIVAPHDCYGGTWRLLDHLAQKGCFRLDFVDQTDLGALEQSLADGCDLLIVETPSNPLLRIVDLSLAATLGHQARAVVLADNTFCSPIRQRPLDFGCDVVVHSTTKFLNGHSDVIGGAIVAAEQDMAEELAHWANVLGVTSGPFDSWLTLRGLRTLAARIEVHDKNAARLVELLCAHPGVTKVYYPGLVDHPGHELAARQQHGFGSMISFELAGGRPAVDAFCADLKVFFLANSLGGVESLVTHPSTMTHSSMTPEAQEIAGLSEGLLRLSVGIDPITELMDDLAAGLDRAQAV